MQPLIIPQHCLSVIEMEVEMKNSLMEEVKASHFKQNDFISSDASQEFSSASRCRLSRTGEYLSVFFCSICQVNILKWLLESWIKKKKSAVSVMNNCCAHSVQVKLGWTGNITWSKSRLCGRKDCIYFDWRLITTVAAHQLPLYDGVKK